MTRILLARHGETDWNRDGRWQGHSDRSLDDAGRAQARRLGTHLARLGVDLLYSSDLARARETAAAVEAATGLEFNSVLANLYRDGYDSVGWHRDSDYAHGGRAAIASVSFGAVRRFELRERAGPSAAAIDLEPGSLLLMDAGAVARWWHRVPKTPRPVGPRVNLTFRYMVAAA